MSDSERWILRARSSLAHADDPNEGVLLEDRFFDLEQATEKAIKAVLTHTNVRFRRSHDFKYLIDECLNDSLRKSLKNIPELYNFGEFNVLRYEGLPDAFDEEYLVKIRNIAAATVEWAAKIVS